MNPNKQVNNIYGYVRVSTLEQARNGSSIELQKDMITEFVKDKYNREVTEFFADEGVSGTIPILDRPESRRLTDVMDEHDVIVTTRLDRFSRSSKNLLNIMPVLEDTKVTLFFCEQFGDIPIVYPKTKEDKGLGARFDMNEITNKIMVMVLSATAEIEHGTIMDRLGDGKVDWAEKGYSIGGNGRPFGYEKVEERFGATKIRTKLVPIPKEQEVIEFMKRARKRGLGYKKISAQVESRFPDFPDFPYHKVKRVLTRKFQAKAS